MTQRSSPFSRLMPPEPAPPWSLVTALVTVAAAFAIILAVSALVLTWLSQSSLTLPLAWTLGCLGIAAFVLQTRRRTRAALRLTPVRLAPPLILLISFGIATLFDLLSLAVTGLFLPVPELLPLAQSRDSIPLWLVSAFLMLVAQPLGEELAFRGVALPALRDSLGSWPGTLACALVYGVFHMLIYPPISQEPEALWYALALPLLDGLVLCMWRTATGSTRAAIFAHAGFGLFALLKVLALAA